MFILTMEYFCEDGNATVSNIRDYLPDGWICIDTEQEIVLVGDERILHTKGDTIEVIDRKTGRTIYKHTIGDFTRFCTVGA